MAKDLSVQQLRIPVEFELGLKKHEIWQYMAHPETLKV